MSCPDCGTLRILKKEVKTEHFRDEVFEDIVDQFYYCEKCKEEFVPDYLMDSNLNQIYNQYRERHNILFPEEIKKLREEYELSPVKMSKILRFGENVYRNYEGGQIPSLSNASTLNLATDPFVFEKMIKENKVNFKNILTEIEIENLLKKIKIKQEEKESRKDLLEYLLEENNRPAKFTGYKLFDIRKYAHCIIFFLTHYGDNFKTYINKFLFYSDFSHYKMFGYSITGSEYVALPKGPCPVRYDVLYEILEENGALNSEEIWTGNGVFEKYESAIDFKKELFSESEMESLINTLNLFTNLDNIKDIVRISHEEVGWIDNEKNKNKIDYQKYAFDLKNL